LIGIFSSPLIAAISVTIGSIQIVILALIFIALGKKGFL